MEDGRNTHGLAPDGEPGGEANGGANGEAKIGRFLEHRRKERGLSLDEVEQATKIRKRYLTGLEREDYAMLPDAVYAQGFLKTYANFLGLDGEALSKQLKSRRRPRRERGIDYAGAANPQEGGFEEPLIAPSGLEGTEKRRFPTSAVVTLVVAVVVLAVVIGALYFVGRGVLASRAEENPQASSGGSPPRQAQQQVADKERAPEAGRPEEDAAGTGGRENPDEASRAVGPDALRVLIDVQERPSWLLIQTDGTTAYERIARPGFSRTFEADRRLYIKSGDAGAVSVEINGQDAGTLGPAYTIAEENYTLKSAS